MLGNFNFKTSIGISNNSQWFELASFKVVICGKYKNLNKIIKILDISLEFHWLLIFVILYT